MGIERSQADIDKDPDGQRDATPSVVLKTNKEASLSGVWQTALQALIEWPAFNSKTIGLLGEQVGT